jgi:hypothetical protein
MKTLILQNFAVATVLLSGLSERIDAQSCDGMIRTGQQMLAAATEDQYRRPAYGDQLVRLAYAAAERVRVVQRRRPGLSPRRQEGSGSGDTEQGDAGADSAPVAPSVGPGSFCFSTTVILLGKSLQVWDDTRNQAQVLALLVVAYPRINALSSVLQKEGLFPAAALVEAARLSAVLGSPRLGSQYLGLFDRLCPNGCTEPDPREVSAVRRMMDAVAPRRRGR